MNQITPIYVCCHEDCPLPKNELLIPLQAGRANAAFPLNMAGDDSGDNISARNQNFCELTVLYWIWRNTRHECFGLCHYRRFLNLAGNETELDSFEEFTARSGHTPDNLNQLMNDYDLILPRAKTKSGGASLYQLYAAAHHIGDLDLALSIIRNVYPHMFQAAETALFNQPLAYYKNMMIARRNFADAYCRWLFDILHRLDCLIYPQLKSRTSYQKRVYGFLAERLFNVFLEDYRRRNTLRVKEVPLLVYAPPAQSENIVWQKVSNS